MLRHLPLYLSLLLLTQCSKCKNDPRPTDPAAQLPPPTQTGANTLGALVNGQPYTPAGRVGLGPNFDVSYDQGFNGGALSVGTYRLYDNNTKQQYLVISGRDISRTGVYLVGANQNVNAFFTDDGRRAPCDDYDTRGQGTFSTGRLTITRLDVRAGIVAGTFEFKLAKSGCDTLRVTQGRFDGTM